MKLDRMRSEIDGIDSMLLELFSNRMEVVARIAQEKQRVGMPIEAPEREREVLARVAGRAEPQLSRYAKVFFSALFDISKAYQRSNLHQGEGRLIKRVGEAVAAMQGKHFPEKAVVALPGVQGSDAHIACQNMFASVDTLHCRDYRSVLDALDKGLCQFGILPLDSSGYGSVSEAYLLLRESGCCIVRSTRVRAAHALLGMPGANPGQVIEVYADARAIGQSGQLLKGNPSAKVTLCDNSMQAVMSAKACGHAGAAAIAPPSLAEQAGLDVLCSIKTDNDLNVSRFACIAKGLTIFPGSDTLSVMLTLPHEPGMLSGLAMRLAALNINMSKLESRKLQQSGLLFADLEAEPGASQLVELLDEMATGPEKLVLLGWHKEV